MPAVFQWLLDRWSPLSSTVRLYLVGLLGCAVGFVLGLLPATGSWAGPVFLAAILLLSFAALREGYGWISVRFNSAPYKFAAGILAIIVAAVATAVAALTINAATGQDPSYFKYSISLLAPLAFVPFLALAGFVIGLVSLPLVMLFSTGKQMLAGGRISNVDVATLFGRIFGVIGVVAFAGQLLDPSVGFEASLARIASYSAYHLDMHVDLSCSATSGDRIVRVSSEIVIVGRPTVAGIRFARHSCPIEAEDGELPPPRQQRAQPLSSGS